MLKIYKSPSTLFLILIFAGLFNACSSSKSFLNKGQQLEEAGLYEEAADFYYIALLKNASNVDAKIGLKKNAQKVLDDKFAKFYQAHGADQFKAAVIFYVEAKDYKEKIEQFVRLDEAAYYKGYYEEAKGSYLRELYEEARNFMEDGKYEQADNNLKEIAKWDSSYGDINTLSKVSTVEPKYQEALAAMDINNYIKAYLIFNEIIEIKGKNYKESAQLRDECLSKAMQSLAVLPFENQSDASLEVSDNFYGRIVQKLLATNNDFLRLTDRRNMNQLIEEQKLGLSGLIDERTAASAGKLLGAKLVLIGKIIQYEEMPGRIALEEKQGFLRVNRRLYNKQGGFYYNDVGWDKVYYQEATGASLVKANFEFQLISSETGEILVGDVFSIEKRDQVNYATFDGPHRDLFAGKWESKTRMSPNDLIYNSIPQKQALDRQLMSRQRNLRAVEDLKWEIIDEIADLTAKKIDAYLKGF